MSNQDFNEVTKREFIHLFKTMYRVGNRSDTPPNEHEEWTHPAMAGRACCALLDQMSHQLVLCKVLTEKERQEIYDDL